MTIYTTLKGRFVSRTKAVGIVRQESIVAGSTCDTYELDFTALRCRTPSRMARVGPRRP